MNIEESAPLSSLESRPANALALFRAVRLFRSFLTARGRGGWTAATVDDSPALCTPLLADYLTERHPHATSTLIDLDSGAEAPVLYAYDESAHSLHPKHAVCLMERAAVFFFSLVNDFGNFAEHLLAAAPDAAQLTAFLRDIDAFSIKRGRQWSEIHVFGRHRIARDRTLTWDDVILPASLKFDIRRNAEFFFANRAVYDSLRMPYKRGFLFVGPPGNGKTMLCRVLASQLDVPCLMTSGGDRPDHLGEIFRRAARLAPCLAIFEDLDSLFERPGELSYFLNLMDGFRAPDGLLVIATTNHPERIAPAILNRPSRFDRVWTIDNPDERSRRDYLEHLFRDKLDHDEIAVIAQATDGFSCAYLKELFLSSAQEAINGCDPGRLRISANNVAAAIPRLRSQLTRASRHFEEERAIGFGT